MNLELLVQRPGFRNLDRRRVLQIETCVDTLLKSCGIHARDVDMVFLTGGTSFVPAVRRIFDARFGPERIKTGNEFTSVAMGLALKASQVSKPGRAPK